MLFHIKDLTWDEDILEALGIPRKILPDVYPSSYLYGETAAGWLGARIPIAACIGNQQADLFGEACFKPGEAKNSYGVGSFFLVNTGDCHVRSKNGLVTTIAWGIGDTVTYALEGSTLVSGISLEWLKHGIGILDSMPESEWIAKSVPDTNGVYLVPSFRGLSAPYWDMESKGLIVGLSDDVNRAHIIRAALAALAYQVRDIYEALSPDLPTPIRELKVSGGASQNNLLMQFQADIMGIPIIRPNILETTALGAAYLAGLAIGFWQDLDELRELWPSHVRYEPQMDEAQRTRLYDGWQTAVEQAMAGMR
ncbi:FGGY family carbohydrate kinase [Mitsuokella multacida]|uniref:FGGY family carbohydrate kinase n=1 Tax=Mitsuokella multacida TaxID=52226 RepID=UPI0022E61A5E|nr:FGGY-family carbohydrate kinase [Mitsuokella multacida]